jgi:hypothetical protein
MCFSLVKGGEVSLRLYDQTVDLSFSLLPTDLAFIVGLQSTISPRVYMRDRAKNSYVSVPSGAVLSMTVSIAL